jgi:vancomycin resistance protein YoaR
LALSRLKGAVIKPGGEFSFNRRVGTFSQDQGYRRAPVSYNGQLISDWGGGVCQTSTTLYNAALLAGMKILERHRHRFAPSYVQPGRDAAVAYTNIDLRFKNPYSYPVRIDGSVEGDVLVISLVGRRPLAEKPQVVSQIRQTQDYQTFRIGKPTGESKVRNSGKEGCEVAVYRMTGDRRELISLDTYPAMNRVVQYR